MEVLNVVVLTFVFAGLLILGLPISICIGISTIATLLLSIDFLPAMATAAHRIGTGLDSFTLLAIPFFILAGQLMNRGGIARRLIEFAKVVVGPLPGGLTFVNIMACMLFGAISGSAVAATAAIGSFMVPMMKKEGYDEDFSAAVNISSSTVGLVIPPSNILIVYSLASGGVSVAALFLAGYIPGIIVGVSLMMVTGWISHRRGYPAGVRVGFREASRRFLESIPSLFLLVLVMGGIVAGVFTATEAAAVAVLYTFVLSVLIYREVRWRELPDVLLETGATTGIVMLLIGTSMAMSWVLAYENIPHGMTAALTAIADNEIVILLVINLILLYAGTFLDMTPAVLIFTPIFLPVVTDLGIDPTHFGIIMVLNLCIGLCTPPVGSVLFVGCGVANIAVVRVIRPLIPLLIAMIASLLLITFVPELSLFLPRWLGF